MRTTQEGAVVTDERFSRCIGALNSEELAVIASSRVLVVGCGGIGGWVVELLCRAGVGSLICADGDVFELSNLNRQHLCGSGQIGRFKAEAAAERAKEINPEISVTAVCSFLDDNSRADLVRGCNLVVDALDNNEDRLRLADECGRQGIWLVHGAIDGWSVQVSAVPPLSGILRRIYGKDVGVGSPSLSFTASFCASVQAAEAVKLLCGRQSALEGKLLCADLRSMTFDIVSV